LDAIMQFVPVVFPAGAAFAGPHEVFLQSDSSDKGEG
jgi:hypothetical protein